MAPGDELGPVVEAAGQLGQQAALADAGLADDEAELRTCGRRSQHPASFRSSVELLLAADEGGGERAQLGAGARQGGGRDPGAERLALALERNGVAGVEREDPVGRRMGGLADGDRHRRGRALQAGGDVDRVAGEEAFARAGVDVETHQGLTGVDADADLDGLAADARQGVDLVDQAQPGAHGALRVVLVQRRHAEDGDHGVADELLDRAAVGLYGLAGDGVVAAEEGVDGLGVVALGDGGEADEVAEEGGDGAALVHGRSARQWVGGQRDVKRHGLLAAHDLDGNHGSWLEAAEDGDELV